MAPSFPRNQRRARIASGGSSLSLCLACLLGARAVVLADARYESTVTGGDRRPLEDRAADASVVTDERTPRAAESVAQLLAELPGVSVQRLGGIGSLAMVSLRGSTFSQVAVYVDGVPLNNGLGGGVDLSTLPLGDVERIEVYRGVAPIAFGGSALGGVVSITTRAPRLDGAAADFSAGSFDTYAMGAGVSVAKKHYRLYVGAHYLTTQGDFWFTTDNGTAFDPAQRREVRRVNDVVSQIDGVARLVIPIGDGRELSVSASVFDREQGVPGYGAIRQTQSASLATLRAIGSVAYDSRRDLGAGGQLRAQAYYRFERQRFGDPLGEIALVPSSTDNELGQVGTTVRVARQATSWLSIAGVLDGRYELFEPYDRLARVPRILPGTRLFIAAGAEATIGIARARMLVIPSLRVEAIRDTRTGRDRLGMPLPYGGAIDHTVPTARIALSARATRWLAVRGNVARYARLPSMDELYGDSGFVIGNPGLVPETGWNSDLGVDVHARGRRFGFVGALTAFGSFVDSLIQFQQESYGRAIALNVGRARILGVEVSLEARMTRYAKVQGSFSFLDARDTSETALGRQEPLLPNRPRFRLYVRPETTLPIPRGVVLGAYAEVDFTDGNYLDPANLVSLPTRTLIGAGVFAEAPRIGLRVVASAQNLGDSRVFDFAGFPLPSRSFFATVRLATAPERIIR